MESGQYPNGRSSSGLKTSTFGLGIWDIGTGDDSARVRGSRSGVGTWSGTATAESSTDENLLLHWVGSAVLCEVEAALGRHTGYHPWGP